MADAITETTADSAVSANTSLPLKDFVCKALTRQVRGKRNFDVNIIKSKPKFAHALFPWVSDPSVAVWQEHVLVIVGERDSAIRDTDHAEKEGETVPNVSQEAVNRPPSVTLPVIGIELALYTVPATSTCLVYVSKVDTTGLLSRAAPTKIVTVALLEYYLRFPPYHSKSVRLHVFARAQDQYLFPGSIDNKQKRVLDDKTLCKWWRSVLFDAANSSIGDKQLAHRLQLFYLLAGYDEAESYAVLPASPLPDELHAARWQYGHPYTLLKPPFPVNDAIITLGDLIPAFQDDPKSRFLTSLTSSTVSAAGEEGDYDEVHERVAKAEETAPALHKIHMADLNAQKLQERARLGKVSVDDYWTLMGGRQECCAGHVAGFFVVAADTDDVKADAEVRVNRASAHFSHLGGKSLPYASYVKLWSNIHNINYASNPKIAEAYAHWQDEVRAAAIRSGVSATHIESEMRGSVIVDNPDTTVSAAKRKEAPIVNSLQPRKKKKAVPP